MQIASESFKLIIVLFVSVHSAKENLFMLFDSALLEEFLITDFCIAILNDQPATFHTDGCSCTFWNNGSFCFDIDLICHQLFNVGKMTDSSDFDIGNFSHGQSIFLLH